MREWLLAPTPTSLSQAALGRFYVHWLTFKTNWFAMVGLGILVLLVVTAVFAPWIAPHSPFEQDLPNRLQPWSSAHWFGTDELGRDIFSRIVYGSRITLYIAFLATVIAGPIGLLIGTVSGYLGGWVDVCLMRITDIFLAFPKLILALAFVVALGPGLDNAIIAIALTSWSPYARMARAEALLLREADFVRAARTQGASKLRIIARHIMPSCRTAVMIRLSLDMSGFILAAAGLGFLGLGAQPPLAEWGSMVASGRSYLVDQWWVTTVPGLAIFLVSLGFNLFADGLRDALDPKRKVS